MSYDHPDAVALIADLQRFYHDRYGAGDDTPVDPAEFAPPRGLFMIGYARPDPTAEPDGSLSPVACGGWRTHDGNPLLRDTDVEIKRMFVVPAKRGRGLSRRLLDALERTARDSGHKRMVLETGIEQPEALNFYRTSGYTAITPFGYHRNDSRARYFGKELV